MNTRKKWYSRVFALAIALALMASVAVPVMAPPDVSADPGAEWDYEWSPEVSGPDWVIAPNSEIYDFAADPAGDIIYAVGMGVDPAARIDYDGGTWSEATARLWKSEDGGVTWGDITDELPDSYAGDDLYYVAIAPDNSDMVFVATATEVYGSNEGGDDFSDSGLDLTGGEIILCLAVSCESDDDYTIAVGTSAGNVWRLVTGGFLGGAWKMIGGYDGLDAVYPGWDDSDVGGLNPSMRTAAVTSVAFSPKFDADDTILAITSDACLLFTKGDGTAEWSTEEAYSGTYSVKLIAPETSYAAARVAYGETLSTLVAATTTIGESETLDVIWNVYYPADGDGTAPYAVLLLDTTGDGAVDAAVVGGFDYVYETGLPTYSSWNKAMKPLAANFQIRDVDSNNFLITGTYGGPYDDEDDGDVHLSDLDASTDWEIDGDDPVVLYVGTSVTKNVGSSFADDIIIDGVTYPLEPNATYLQTGRLGNVEQWNAIAGSAFPDAVEIVDAAPLQFDGSSSGATGIALSADYDGRKSDLRYTWVYVDYDDPDLGLVGRVFQIDNDDVDYAGLPCVESKFTPLLASISAYGTEEEGKLMVGLLGRDEEITLEELQGGDFTTDCCEGVQVYYTTMPIDTCCPDWDSSDKPPTGQGRALVAYVADGDKAYASTLGEGRADEGAFSISDIEEVGLYWNQYSLIDTDIDYLSDFATVQDTWNAGQYFVVSINLMQEDNGEEEGCVAWPNQVCECDSVWYSEDWGEHYMRVWCGEFTPNAVNVAFLGAGEDLDDPTDQVGFIRLAPEEGSWVETIYLVDRGTETVWWNDSSGLTDWSDQSTCTVDAIGDLAVGDSSTIYALSADAAEVAKSTDNGESWDDPVDADMVISGEAGHTIAVRGDEVLFGSDGGSVSYSDDGGDSFEILGCEGSAGSGNIHVAFDAYYGLNDTVYSADDGGGGIRRWVIGSSSSFERLDAWPTLDQMGGSGTDEEDVAYYGIVSKSSGMCDAEDGGVLYAAYAYSYNATTYYTGVARSLTPAADLCCDEADWDYLHTGLTTGAEDMEFPQQFTTEPSSLKVSGTSSYILIDVIDNASVFADYIMDPLYMCSYYGYDYWWGLGVVYYYEDCFAADSVCLSAPGSGSLIPSDPCACWNEKFVLEWEQPCDACLYDVQIALDEDFNDIYWDELDYDPPSARSPSLVIKDGDLDCSTTYYWRVRSVEADTGEVVRSWWSVAWDFAVEAGPMGAIELTAPDNGDTDVPVAGLVFIWTSVAGADTYNFSLMDASGTEVDSQIGLTGTSYAYAGTLGLDTAYTWQVTAMKGTGMSASDTVSVSRVSTFRTVSAAVFTCPQCGLPFATEAALEAHIADAHSVPEPTTPSWVWVIIGLGAVLVITVIVLIFRTRRV